MTSSLCCQVCSFKLSISLLSGGDRITSVWAHLTFSNLKERLDWCWRTAVREYWPGEGGWSTGSPRQAWEPSALHQPWTGIYHPNIAGEIVFTALIFSAFSLPCQVWRGWAGPARWLAVQLWLSVHITSSFSLQIITGRSLAGPAPHLSQGHARGLAWAASRYLAIWESPQTEIARSCALAPVNF